MNVGLVSILLLMMQPVADPSYFSVNSPQCVAERLLQFNPLPVMVKTDFPPCPWSSDDAALVEIGRQLSNYSWWNFERTTNLELAAAKIDGTMLMPGEMFSYNETVGERTEANGFKEAKVIDYQGYTDGIGGGVCQPASTLYAAALLAGLDVEERWTHRFRIKYMPPGLDATVDYGKKDLKLVNNTRFPVVFQMGRLEKGEFLVRVFAPVRTWRVKYRYEIVQETPSSTVSIVKPEEGEDLVEYYGRPGFELKKLIFRRNLFSRKVKRIRVRNDIYEPSPWTLRMAAPPGGKRYLSGLSTRKVNALLKGTNYTTDSARFYDIAHYDGSFLKRSYVPRKKLRIYERFSDVQKYIDLASLAVPGQVRTR